MGTLYDRLPANETPYIANRYVETAMDDTSYEIEPVLEWTTTQEEYTDIAAVRANYISVSKIRNMILR